uniref:Unkown protein n=1 Tax=Riptortus pedestris TaxID=329032 RepID=R4WDX3_RIPPE|nr:unkown protein [Riptortus pedestris]
MPVFVALDESHETWGIIELQGELKSRAGGKMNSLYIGDLHFGMQSDGVPTLMIGHHIMYGKAVTLDKPWAILEKHRSGNNTEYVTKVIIEKKLVFKSRPKPIIAAVPGN